MKAWAADMRQLIDGFDWTHTSLGAQSEWPESLRLMLEVALRSRFPMLIFWGRDLLQLYNDAFIPILGPRHPAALGEGAKECWPEMWETMGPLVRNALEHGESSWLENVPFFTERNGFPERVYFTISFSQFGDARGERGVLCTTVETTAAVFRELEFREMADSIADIIFTQAPDGTVEWANSRWYQYAQLPPALALTPAGWAQVTTPEDFLLVQETLERAIATGQPYEMEIRIKPYGTSDENLRWFLDRAVPIRAADGSVVRWAGSLTDIHDRRVAEDALRQRLERDLDREHRASIAFQNAALPRSLPTVPGLTFDAIYEGSERNVMVGGDWYDAFRLSDGRVCVSVGDVVGNGLDAAVTMSAVRQAIRGAAQVFPEPAAVLNAADRALRSEQPDRIVTVFLGIIDPLTRSLSYASAGHPPPVIRLRTEETLELDARGLPLGLRNEPAPGESSYLSVPDGALLVLYTDGLIESTRDLLEGESKLRAAIAREEIVTSAFPAAAIRDAVLEEPTDDIAILTVRFGAVSARVRRWSCRLDNANEVMRMRRGYASALKANEATEEEIADAELVFGELLANVVRHTDGRVDVALDLSAAPPVLHVLDRGPGFTFHAHLPNDQMSETGRGLFIMTKLAREVSVAPRHKGGSHARVVLAVKRRTIVGATNARPVPELPHESPSAPLRG